MNQNKFGCDGTPDRVGVLIAQLGTPDAPDRPSLRRYLKQFLSDPRVIEANRFVWYFILNGIILQKRPQRSAALYQRIWTDEGSPLMCITESQTSKVSERLHKIAPEVQVVFGMRYGRPSLESAIDQLVDGGCGRILLFPMYPQYSGPTTASTYDAVFKHMLKRRWIPTLRVAEPYYLSPHYVRAQADVINNSLAKLDQKPERLMLNFHGVPRSFIEKGDPYCCMCTETYRALVPLINMPADRILQCYQSRFGKEPWLEPYADETVVRLAKEGVKHMAIACPGFTADCLETLDELGNEARHLFIENGGERFDLFPSLNDQAPWIDGMTSIIQEELGNWIDSGREGRYAGKVCCPSGMDCLAGQCKVAV
jgi:ferrochelatase